MLALLLLDEGSAITFFVALVVMGAWILSGVVLTVLLTRRSLTGKLIGLGMAFCLALLGLSSPPDDERSYHEPSAGDHMIWLVLCVPFLVGLYTVVVQARRGGRPLPGRAIPVVVAVSMGLNLCNAPLKSAQSAEQDRMEREIARDEAARADTTGDARERAAVLEAQRYQQEFDEERAREQAMTSQWSPADSGAAPLPADAVPDSGW